jgi:hypothetical protein
MRKDRQGTDDGCKMRAIASLNENVCINQMSCKGEDSQWGQNGCQSTMIFHWIYFPINEWANEQKIVAGLSIRGGTRYFYPPKMVFGTSWF